MAIADHETDARLADLEGRLAALQARVETLEAGSRPSAPPRVEIPIATDALSQNAEYWLGAKFLPRFGAVLIIVAIAFVAASESSKNALLPPSALLAIEALVCLAFIVVGEWKRNELEGFGTILSAIGSCSLYLTAAGGHFAYHRLTGAQMAGGFAVLTLLNHTFAVWRNSRLFFFIGASGGLAAMLFPLSESDYGTALVVYAAVTVAGAIVCAIRKWSFLAIVGWFLGLLILMPVIDSESSRLAIVVAMYGGSMACIWAYAHSCSGSSLDPTAIGAPIALFLTALLAMFVQHEAVGLLHLLPFCAVGLAAGLIVQRVEGTGRPLAIGACASTAMLAPLALPSFFGSLVYSALAVAAFFIGLYALTGLAATFAIIELLGAGMAYIWALGRVNIAQEHAMLAGIAVAIAFSAGALRRARVGWVGYAVMLSWILIVRWSMLLAPAHATDNPTYSPLTLALVGYAALLLVLGFQVRSVTLRLWSMVVMLGSVVQVLFLAGDTCSACKLGALVALGVMMLVAGYRYLHSQRSTAPEPDAAPELPT